MSAPGGPAGPVRAFAALELPDAVLRRLAGLGAALRAAGPPGLVRWSRPDGLHLTLQFYGDVQPERLAGLQAALAAIAAQSEPITLGLSGLGAFPDAAHARVVWVGVAGQVDRLRSLQGAIEAASSPLGFPAERRPFHPHLTLGRVGPTARPAQLQLLAAALARTRPAPGPDFTLTELSLMQSQLRPGGSVYTRLSAAPLSGGRGG